MQRPRRSVDATPAWLGRAGVSRSTRTWVQNLRGSFTLFDQTRTPKSEFRRWVGSHLEGIAERSAQAVERAYAEAGVPMMSLEWAGVAGNPRPPRLLRVPATSQPEIPSCKSSSSSDSFLRAFCSVSRLAGDLQDDGRRLLMQGIVVLNSRWGLSRAHE